MLRSLPMLVEWFSAPGYLILKDLPMSRHSRRILSIVKAGHHHHIMFSPSMSFPTLRRAFLSFGSVQNSQPNHLVSPIPDDNPVFQHL